MVIIKKRDKNNLGTKYWNKNDTFAWYSTLEIHSFMKTVVTYNRIELSRIKLVIPVKMIMWIHMLKVFYLERFEVKIYCICCLNQFNLFETTITDSSKFLCTYFISNINFRVWTAYWNYFYTCKGIIFDITRSKYKIKYCP